MESGDVEYVSSMVKSVETVKTSAADSVRLRAHISMFTLAN